MIIALEFRDAAARIVFLVLELLERTVDLELSHSDRSLVTAILMLEILRSAASGILKIIVDNSLIRVEWIG